MSSAPWSGPHGFPFTGRPNFSGSRPFAIPTSSRIITSTTILTVSSSSPSSSAPSSPGAPTSVVPSSSGALIEPTQTPQSINASRQTPVGAIVGGVVAGVVLLSVVALIIVLYRRRRRRATQPATIVPLVHDENYVPPPEKSDRYVTKISNMLHNPASSPDHLRDTTGSSSRILDSEGRLHDTVQLMSERIGALELELQQNRQMGDNPPPDYSTVTTSNNPSTR